MLVLTPLNRVRSTEFKQSQSTACESRWDRKASLEPCQSP